MKKTQLFEYHSKHAKLTEFAGYEMPLWYTTITEEHMAVRNKCGIFDVSHMGRFSVQGKDSGRFLEGLVPTSVQSQPDAKSFYTLLLNEAAGIIDDLIIMRKTGTDFLVVVNAANASRDLDHIRRRSGGYDVQIDDVTGRTAMIAVQGPEAAAALQRLTAVDLMALKRFRSIDGEALGRRCTISRTGYTGEDGFEVIVYDTTVDDPAAAAAVWDALAKPAKPCGLGARDSLRLEAGFPLHGSDIDDKTNPFEAGLSWVVSADKTGYVGYDAVSRLRASPPARVRRGIVLDEGIPRHGFEVLDAQGGVAGQVTSGTFSPVLRKGIALAMIRRDIPESSGARVRIRETSFPGRYVKPPFYDESLYGWKRGSKSK
ncbi:MAG: glycine cleavage system aminomethyltransferase GcvT [Nitrososphaerales archaeon]|nr:glycine cleavage system aminomethyltransferase GcvT [Nitrososphaerales archaeon]